MKRFTRGGPMRPDDPRRGPRPPRPNPLAPLQELLAAELEPYVGRRAEFIAERITPKIAKAVLEMVDQAIDDKINNGRK